MSASGANRPPDGGADTVTRSRLDPPAGTARDRHPHLPSLLLLFTPSGPARLEAHAIPAEGVVLGRGAALFGDRRLDDQRMSRRHAEVRGQGGGFVIADLGSRNRTRVNGVEIAAPQVLHPGDIIRLGDTHLAFCTWQPEASDLADRELIGASPESARLRDRVGRVAARDTTVLISGETGTGKDVLARRIHRLSGRAGKYVAINCGGLSEGVLESELFGHVRGAFTGAVQGSEGLFRAADDGTLFLDELGEMPLPFQVKLLRVLETGRIRPIGASQETAVRVRVIAATHRDVPGEVLAGRFRADLYSRLAQWLVAVPPLRERRADIPLLVEAFLARGGHAGRGVDPNLAEALLLHDWPLNVRGLANVLTVATIAAGDSGPLHFDEAVERSLFEQRRLGSASSPAVVPPSSPVASAPPAPAVAAPPAPVAAAPPTPAPPKVPARLPDDGEIEAALAQCRGRISDAARLLGVSRQQLYRWAAAHEGGLERFRAEDSGDGE